MFDHPLHIYFFSYPSSQSLTTPGSVCSEVFFTKFDHPWICLFVGLLHKVWPPLDLSILGLLHKVWPPLDLSVRRSSSQGLTSPGSVYFRSSSQTLTTPRSVYSHILPHKVWLPLDLYVLILFFTKVGIYAVNQALLPKQSIHIISAKFFSASVYWKSLCRASGWTAEAFQKLSTSTSSIHTHIPNYSFVRMPAHFISNCSQHACWLPDLGELPMCRK